MDRKATTAIAVGVMTLGLALGAAAPANATGIQLWQFHSYSGEYLGDFGGGTSYVGTIADNRASSMKVNDANYAILHQFRDYGGAASTTFYVGAQDLAEWGFDNLTSSIS